MKIYNKSVALAESITVQSEPCDPTEQQFAVEWREFFSQSAASLVLSIFTRQSTEATAKGKARICLLFLLNLLLCFSVPEWGEKYLKGKVLASVSEAGASLSKTDLLNNNLKLTLCPEMDFLKYVR